MDVAHESASSEADFPVSRCARCRRDVLTHVHLDARGAERRLCLHCDAEIDPEEVRWVRESDLGPLGYELEGREAGGCGRPGCGRGSCVNRQ
jgi:hypothetical protein